MEDLKKHCTRTCFVHTNRPQLLFWLNLTHNKNSLCFQLRSLFFEQAHFTLLLCIPNYIRMNLRQTVQVAAVPRNSSFATSSSCIKTLYLTGTRCGSVVWESFQLKTVLDFFRKKHTRVCPNNKELQTFSKLNGCFSWLTFSKVVFRG